MRPESLVGNRGKKRTLGDLRKKKYYWIREAFFQKIGADHPGGRERKGANSERKSPSRQRKVKRA